MKNKDKYDPNITWKKWGLIPEPVLGTPKPLRSFPSYENIINKYYNTEMSLFCIYLCELAYYYYGQIEYPKSDDAISLINEFLPSEAKVVDVLSFTCPLAMDWYKETYYGGIIIDYTINGIVTRFIVFKGTSNICELDKDAQLYLVPTNWLRDQRIKVHKGFNDIYTSSTSASSSLREQLWDYLFLTDHIDNLIITGHSMGGSLCELLIADITANKPELRMKTKSYIMAGAYTGNQQFVDLITSVNTTPIYSGIFQLINKADIVPMAKSTLEFKRIPMQLFCFIHINIVPILGPHLPILYEEDIIKNSELFENNAKTKASCGIECELI